MMDPARAAPVLNLDAKAQAKSPNDGKKAEAGDKKIKFQDTLNRQTPPKGQQVAAEVKGGRIPQILLDNDGPPAPEVMLESAEAEQAPPRIKKPIVLLHAALKPAPQANGEAEGEVRTESRLDLKTIAKPKAKKDHGHKPDVELDADAAPDADRVPDLKPDDADADAEPVRTKPARRDPRLAADDARDAADLPAQKNGERAEPVKDVLILLHEKTPDTAPVDRPLHAHETTADVADDSVTAAGGQDQGKSIYRLSRADGKGGALDIPSADQPVMPEAHTPETVVNPVTVVDQRRYLAPAQDNALAVINTIGGNQEWVSAMQPDSSLANAAAMAGSGKVVNTLKIQMHPIELGLVTATMRLAGEELTVELKVENGNAYRQLKEDQSRIVEALKAQGFSVDQVSVVLAPDRPEQGNGQSNTMQNGQGSTFAQQQNQARGGAQGQAPGRGNGGYQQETGRNGNFFGDEGRSDVGPVGGRGPAGTGSLYL